MLTATIVNEASIQDRDDTVPLLISTREGWPWLRHVFADGGYAGSKLEEALAKAGRWILVIDGDTVLLTPVALMHLSKDGLIDAIAVLLRLQPILAGEP